MTTQTVDIDMTTGGSVCINFNGSGEDKSIIIIAKGHLKQQLFKVLEGNSEFLITAKKQ